MQMFQAVILEPYYCVSDTKAGQIKIRMHKRENI